jgi:hypothetical protein
LTIPRAPLITSGFASRNTVEATPPDRRIPVERFDELPQPTHRGEAIGIDEDDDLAFGVPQA